MRIISGKYARRQIQAPQGKTTRPTLDKNRESIFNIWGPYYQGGVCLDLFAGSGAIGIECLSRGMEQAVFVDKDVKAIECIKVNLANLKITKEEATVLKMDYRRALAQVAHRKFDFIYLDPPYKMEIYEEVLQSINDYDCCNGVVLCESDISTALPEQVGQFKKEKEKTYGIVKITSYRRF